MRKHVLTLTLNQPRNFFSSFLFACDFGKRGLVLIITSETELEISRPLCKRFWYEKSLKKRPRSALRLLREQVGFDVKRHCVLTGFRMRLKA